MQDKAVRKFSFSSKVKIHSFQVVMRTDFVTLEDDKEKNTHIFNYMIPYLRP